MAERHSLVTPTPNKGVQIVHNVGWLPVQEQLRELKGGLRFSLMNPRTWLYRGGHPNWLASVINRCWAVIHARGVAPDYLVTLEVRGRQSGRRISLPLVMVILEGERYLVSMLGAEANWVRNVHAAGGDVTLRHGRREDVHLEEIAVDRRAPVLKAYLERAPGARQHLPINKDAPLSEFERVAAQIPVFRVVSRGVDK